MNILDRYGIKEVADVTFYEIADNGEAGAPVLYLDTLKVSTIEQTAESTSARGGKGNPELIMWDYGKEITVTLEDALFSAKSMALMYGVDINNTSDFGKETTILKTVKPSQVSSDGSKITINVISSDKFPKTYYITGDTYARSEATGKDEFFQFIIPKAKMQSEVTLTMEAEGDPSTFNMNLKVLRPADGDMMKLVKYSI